MAEDPFADMPNIFSPEDEAAFKALDKPFETGGELTLKLPDSPTGTTAPAPTAPPPPPSEPESVRLEREAAQQAIRDRVAAQEAATPKPPVATAPSESSIFDFDFSQYQLDPVANRCGGFFATRAGCAAPAPSFITTEQITKPPTMPPKEMDEGIIASIISALKLAATAPPAGEPDETGNLAPGLAAGVIRDILKGVGVTVALGAIGYQLAGWKGALGGALLWLAPNIGPALAAKAEVEKALGT